MGSMRLRLLATLSLLEASPVIAGGLDGSTQPAMDVITRNFGAAAARTFNLQLLAPGSACGGSAPPSTSTAAAATTATSPPPCFAYWAGANGTVTVEASSMSELTYGIGHYVRHACGLTVGWINGGGTYTVPSAGWPCSGPWYGDCDILRLRPCRERPSF